MKDYNEFGGKDLEHILVNNGIITKNGYVNRDDAAAIFSVCKKTVGNWINGKITPAAYQLIALHTGHQKPQLRMYGYGRLGLTDGEALSTSQIWSEVERQEARKKADREFKRILSMLTAEDLK